MPNATPRDAALCRATKTRPVSTVPFRTQPTPIRIQQHRVSPGRHLCDRNHAGSFGCSFPDLLMRGIALPPPLEGIATQRNRKQAQQGQNPCPQAIYAPYHHPEQYADHDCTGHDRRRESYPQAKSFAPFFHAHDKRRFKEFRSGLHRNDAGVSFCAFRSTPSARRQSPETP